MSLAALIWLCVLKTAGQRASERFSALVISAALLVFVDKTHVLLMLPSYEAYRGWHDEQDASASSPVAVSAAVVRT